ncbi:hypothetical protein BH20ACT8_BH20ACT8_07470 [soil metagenome]
MDASDSPRGDHPRGVRVVGDRYELLSQLGRGGVGTVWLAQDTLLRRHVAVKQVTFPDTLPPDERDTIRARFMREARIAAGLTHPSVTQIFDVLADEGTAYLVMELVDAPTLAAIVRDVGPLDPEHAARVGLDVLAALEAAHAKGVVHRDVKPSNVMVPHRGPAKLADFGIASVADDATLTATGLILGSPSFMAPEQATSGTSGPATDLWGLGATLYCAVEGVPPFDRGGAIPTLTAVLHDPPRHAAAAGPLAPLLEALLAKEPADRPGAAQVRTALEAVAGGVATAPVSRQSARARHEPEEAVPATLPTREPGEGARHDRPRAEPGGRGRRLAVLGILVLLGLAAFAVLSGEPSLLEVAVDDGPSQPQAAQPATEPAATEPAATDPAEDPAEDPATPAPGPTEDETTVEPTPTSSPAPPPTDASADDGTVPDDWSSFTVGASGATVAHPPDWEQVQREPFRFDLTDPDSATYLRVEFTDTPAGDAVADWQRQSASFGSRFEGYEELRIEPIDYRDYDNNALWEYRYDSGGAELRAYNFAVVAEGRGYALNLVTTEDRWEEVQPLFDAFLVSFEPGPAA